MKKSDSELFVSSKAGLPPGTLMYIGKDRKEKIGISLMDYSKDSFFETEYDSIQPCLEYKDNKSVTWINVDGLHDTQIISEIGEKFEIHPLVLEDILNTRLRPSIEEYDDYIFVSLKMMGISADSDSIINEQISFVVGDKWIISFQERKGDIFDGLRGRIKEGKGTIRARGVDFLFYRLIDTVVDHYFFVTEFMNNKIDQLEEEVMVDESDGFIQEVQYLKKKLINLRRTLTPVREIVFTLKKDQNEVFDPNTRIYMDDVYDHMLQINESIESQREALTSILELHTSLLGQKMNQIMKVLTIMASIFIPLTFVAGIYGMNFQYMPELGWKYAYPMVWGIMILMMIGMIAYFRKKKWI